MINNYRARDWQGEPPPKMEKYLVWYKFLKHMPTTIFWVSLGYLIGFAVLTMLLGFTLVVPTGIWWGVYVLGGMLFVAALYLCFAGWLSRRIE